MSAKAGWYPDPGGGVGLFRYWDGKAWSAATSPNPAAPAPSGVPSGGSAGSAGSQSYQAGGYGSGYGSGSSGSGSSGSGSYRSGSYGSGSYGAGSYGSGSYGAGSYGSSSYGSGGSSPGGYPSAGSGQQTGGYPGQSSSAYANYQQQTKKRTPVGWWIGAAALLVVIVVVAVIAIRAIGGGTLGGSSSGEATGEVCPPKTSVTSPIQHPNDGRVYGGPLSYPELGDPWDAPRPEDRVPFGSDVAVQEVMVEPNYQPNANWVASILVGELQAGDGFFTPEQGSQIVVKCILGTFYGDNPVNSDVRVNQATTIDGHEGWLVESHLTFDIENLRTKGELLIVAIVSAGARSGLYYASIPDTTPQLVPTARQVLKELRVEG
ncbi:DUF2510 domain-containing protein [Microlunatus ginsengisoli]|uniref:DUF2510 domain-containing protein n=1 Tax=Microlunatus ginsengisoli TaxID=363863 RepID=A0ABP6ZHB9_9ACTN